MINNHIFPTSKFQIGQFVVSKKTGLPGLGCIIGIVPFFVWREHQKEHSPYWSHLYPDYRAKCIYMVYYEQPRKNLTIEEFLNSSAVNTSSDLSDADLSYLKTVYAAIPALHLISYPEDDLELLT